MTQNDSGTQDESEWGQEARGQGGLFLGRFYSSKLLAFPVLGHKKGPSSKGEVCSGTILRQHEGLLQLIVDIRIK